MPSEDSGPRRGVGRERNKLRGERNCPIKCRRLAPRIHVPGVRFRNGSESHRLMTFATQISGPLGISLLRLGGSGGAGCAGAAAAVAAVLALFGILALLVILAVTGSPVAGLPVVWLPIVCLSVGRCPGRGFAAIAAVAGGTSAASAGICLPGSVLARTSSSRLGWGLSHSEERPTRDCGTKEDRRHLRGRFHTVADSPLQEEVGHN